MCGDGYCIYYPEELQCDMCDSTDAEWQTDPYLREIEDEEVIRALCDECYQGRADDI